MTYPHRYHMACPAAAPAVRQLFALQYGIAGFQELRTGLSAAADPTGPVTWFASSFLATEAERAALRQLEDDGRFDGGAAFYLRSDAGTGAVVATNCPAWAGLVGSAADFPAALALLGLAFHRPAGGP